MARMIVNDDPEDSAAANAASLYQPSVAKPTAAEIMKMVTGLLPNPNNLQLSDAMAAMKTEAAAQPPTGAEIMKMVTGLLPNPNNLQMSDALAALKTEAAVTPTGLLASTTPAATTGIPQSIIDKMNATGAPVLENGIYYQPIYGDERGSGETYERGSPTSYVSYSEAENKAGGAYTTHDLTGKEISTGVQQEVDTGLKSMIAPLLAGVAMAVGLPPGGFESIFGTAGTTVAESAVASTVVPGTGMTLAELTQLDLSIGGTGAGIDLAASMTGVPAATLANQVISTVAASPAVAAVVPEAAATISQVVGSDAFVGEALADAGLLSGGGAAVAPVAALAPAAVAPSAFVGEALADAGLLSGGTGMTAAVAPVAAAGTTAAALAPAAVAPATAAAGTAAATGLLSGAASTVGSTLANALIAPGSIGGLLQGAGGYLQTEESKAAAKLAAQNMTAATKAATEGAQFKPIGTTTRFGTSQFGYDPTTGQMTSAGYTLSPEAKAQQDRFVALQNAGLTQAEQAQAQFAPLQTGAQSMFSLGNQYLAQNPQDVAGNYLKQQMALLAPGRELELANLQNKLQQQGRGGLSVAQGGGYGATTPELQAMYNARAMQEAQLAANAEQAGQRNVLFGAGLLGQGSTAMGNYYTGQKQAYEPYTTASGQVQGLEALGQAPMTTSLGIGRDVSTAGARAGQLGIGGTQAAGNFATTSAATVNPLANILGGLGGSNAFTSTLSGLFGGVNPYTSTVPATGVNPYPANFDYSNWSF